MKKSRSTSSAVTLLVFLVSKFALGETNHADFVWNAYVKQIQQISESDDIPNSKFREITANLLKQVNLMRKKIVSQELKIQRMEKGLSEKSSSLMATTLKFRCTATSSLNTDFRSEAIGIYKAMQAAMDNCQRNTVRLCALESCTQGPFRRLNKMQFEAFRQNFYVNHWIDRERE